MSLRHDAVRGSKRLRREEGVPVNNSTEFGCDGVDGDGFMFTTGQFSQVCASSYDCEVGSDLDSQLELSPNDIGVSMLYYVGEEQSEDEKEGTGHGEGKKKAKNARVWNLDQISKQRVFPLDDDLYADEHGKILESRQCTRSGANVLDCFERFCTEKLVKMIAVQMSLRHLQQDFTAPPGMSEQFSAADVYEFLAVLYWMAVYQLEDDRDYWATWYVGGGGLPGIPTPQEQKGFVSSTMSRDKFSWMKRCFCTDNPDEEQYKRDVLAKVRYIWDHTKRVCKANYVPGRFLALGESQITCCNRNVRFLYRGEDMGPMSDYVKVLSLNEVGTGYQVGFEADVRDGKHTVGEYVTQTICNGLDAKPSDKGFKPRVIAADKFYISVNTVEYVHFITGNYLYGTIKQNMGPHHCKELADGAAFAREYGNTAGAWRWAESMSRDAGHLAVSDNTIPLALVRWHDTKKEGCLFLSPIHPGSAPSGGVRRQQQRSRDNPSRVVSIQAPLVAAEYCKHIGACAEMNSKRACFSTQLSHRRRWFMGLVYFCLDVMQNNAYIIYRKQGGTLDHKMFVLHLAAHLREKAHAPAPCR